MEKVLPKFGCQLTSSVQNDVIDQFSIPKPMVQKKLNYFLGWLKALERNEIGQFHNYQIVGQYLHWGKLVIKSSDLLFQGHDRIFQSCSMPDGFLGIGFALQQI